ncbi:hypothetical protein JOQ06_007907 [Pogonophryne albipinna]|uniref:Uncharacterized protein n=1 Tax=Pogonophryne albipinna TaxID=1090488 RepID=A0AAD6A632_9TELE|nr:hypothetical protein JOQ06_007907 [Pogonophryne albipinna]
MFLRELRELRGCSERSSEDALNVPQRAQRMEEEQKRKHQREEEEERRPAKKRDLDSCANCDSVFFSLEAEQRESGRLKNENKALINGIFTLQTEVTSLQTKLKEQTDSQSEELNTAKARLQDMESQSEELNTAKSRLRDLESQSEEKAVSYNNLMQEVKRLRQEVKEEEPSRRFVSALQDLKEESQAALQRSAEKSQLIQDLQEERSQLHEERSQLQEERSQLQEERSQLQRRLDHSENRCAELSEELSNQRAAFSQPLQGLRAELESERGALRGRLQEERAELLRAALEKEKLLEECRRETETLRKELERLKEELQSREEEEEEEEEEEVMPVVQELEEELQSREEEEERQEVMPVVQELEEELQSRQEEEERQEVMPVVQELKEELQSREEEDEERQEVMPVVQELKEELQKLKERREERELDAVRREMQRLEEERGGAQNLVSSENKRNRGRGNTRTNKQSSAVREKCDGALQKIGDLINSSPSILGSTAKSIMGLVSGHSVEKEAVQRPKRGRRKLFKMGATLQDSPDAMSGRANEEKESDHLIIKRQLRSKTCRK